MKTSATLNTNKYFKELALKKIQLVELQLEVTNKETEIKRKTKLK